MQIWVMLPENSEIQRPPEVALEVCTYWFAALRKKLLTYDDYRDSLEDLVKAGFRMSDEVYLEAVRLGRGKLKPSYET